jgi:serine/threonine protein kinase
MLNLQKNLSSLSSSSNLPNQEELSGAAGTRRYMAPEWTQIVDRSLKRQASDLSVKTNESLESLKKLDIYALGIILADLVCNPVT